jgi:beta-ribofuranosylaminobenzene 5'-phosphate synthase
MKLQITTPSRLHFGLIDLNGELGRINGGFGVALRKPSWKIILDKNIEKNHSNYTKTIDILLQKLDTKFKFKTLATQNFQILNEIPNHVGFGSGTQFALAIAWLYAEFNKLVFSSREFAKIVNRGGTSGIGVASFDQGGFIVDGGHSFGPDKETNSFLPSAFSQAHPPPVLFQYKQPLSWQFIIITPSKIKGLSGKEELAAFQKQCPLPADEAEKLSRLLLMKILPSIIEQDIATLGYGLIEMQTKFKRFGMEQYNNTIVEEVLTYFRKNKLIFGSGISSFGPTIFGLVENKKVADEILSEFNENFSEKNFILVDKSSINTTGAKIVKL